MRFDFFEKAFDFLGDHHMALPIQVPETRRGLVELLPYRAYDEGNKLYFNEGSFGWIMELPPLMGGNDELIKLLSSTFAGRLPENCLFQILHLTDPLTNPIFDLWAEPRRKRQGIFKKLADKRCEYFSASGWSSLFSDSPFLTRRCRVFLSCALPGPLNLNGKEKLDLARSAVKQVFKSLAVAPKELTPDDFLNLLYPLLWPNPDQSPPRLAYHSSDSLHLQLIEPEADLSVVSDSLRWSTGVDMAVLNVLGYPEFWPQWRNGELMGQEFNDLMRPVCPVLTCFSFTVKDKESASGRIFIKSAKATRKADSDYRRFFPDIVKQASELKCARGHLENGQALVQAGYRIAVMAPRSHLDLEDAVQSVRSLYEAQGFRLGRERNCHLPAFLSMLPHFGAGNLEEKGYGIGPGRTKSMLTWSCANLAPLQGDWQGGVGDHPPGLLLFSRRGEPALWNPFDAKTGNYNIAVAGRSGSGKSVLMQELMASMAGAGTQVLVIDDGRSFEHACHMLGGQFVAFSTDSEICLNPFSAVDAETLAEDKDYCEETLTLIVDMVCQACHANEDVTDWERSAISRAVREAWETEGTQASFSVVRDRLLDSSDPRARDLAMMMADYCRGGLSERFFEGKCTLQLNADLMVFELGEIKTRKNLESLVLMMIIFLGTQRMFRSARNRATAIFIDEAWHLLGGKSSGEFINGVARRARKYKGSLITGTQSVEDYYRTPAALAAFENAETYLFLSQNRESINFLKKEERIDCDEDMEAALKSLRKIDNKYSEFLMIDDGGYRLLRLILDPYSMAIYSSKGEDWQEVKKHLKAGKSIEKAVESVAQKISREAA